MPTQSEIEQMLAGIYVGMFQADGYSPTEAMEIFEGLLEKARKAARESAYANIHADWIFAHAEHPEIKAELEWKAAEGVSEADIRWWWSMHEIERQVVLEVDRTLTISPTYSALRKNGASKEEATQKLWKIHPRYAIERSQFLDEPLDADSPLPIELKQRIIAWGERQRATDPTGAELTALMERYSSFNALVRNEIQQGKL